MDWLSSSHPTVMPRKKSPDIVEPNVRVGLKIVRGAGRGRAGRVVWVRQGWCQGQTMTSLVVVDLVDANSALHMQTH